MFPQKSNAPMMDVGNMFHDTFSTTRFVKNQFCVFGSYLKKGTYHSAHELLIGKSKN